MSSTSIHTPVPAAAFMLADHLDAALAAGEDILAVGERTVATQSVLSRGPGAATSLRSSVELIRALELAVITRVLKAREWSATLTSQDERFRLIGGLFQSGTVQLVDALAEFVDATQSDFDTGDGITAYFRNRGALDGEAVSLGSNTGTLVTPTFRIAGRMEIGALMDLIAAYLDAMEVHVTLFASPTLNAPNVSEQLANEHVNQAAGA